MLGKEMTGLLHSFLGCQATSPTSPLSIFISQSLISRNEETQISKGETIFLSLMFGMEGELVGQWKNRRQKGT